MFINRSGAMVLPFLGVYMTDHLGFGLKHAGLVLSFYGVGSVVGSWLGGMITDKIGEFKVQSFSLILSVPMFCLIPFFKSEEGLALIIFLQSTISESFRPANSVAITKYARPGNITRSFSLNRMAVNLGFSVGPALGGILSAISYDFLFYSNALGALFAGIVYIRFFGKRHKHFKQQSVETVSKSVSPYRDRKFLVFSLNCLVFSVCFFQILNTLTIFYKQEAQLSQQQIGYILGYSGFIIVILEMLFVQIAEKKFRLGQTLFIGAFLCGISFAMLSFNHSLILLVISMTVLCIGEIWTLPFLSTVTALRSGLNNKGAYMGLLGMGFSIAFILTPYLGTLIAQKFGFTTLWIGTGILMAFVATAFRFIIPWMLNDTKEEPNN
jgi:predicted MFS family arabinose efflux permease